MYQLTVETAKKKIIWTASLNGRGQNENIVTIRLGDDMVSYKILILRIQETHMKDTEIEGIVTSDNTQTFILFHTGPNNSSLHGVWIVVHKDLKPQFNRISDIICQREILLQNDQNPDEPKQK